MLPLEDVQECPVPEMKPPHTKASPDRPNFPASYGVHPTSTDGMQPWRAVRDRLAKARNYWVTTTRPNGRSHAMPVWGVWLDEAFYFATDRESRKAKNLATNRNLVVHLESGDEVVIVEGSAEEVAEHGVLDHFVIAYDAKYRFRPDPGNASQLVYRVRPQVVLAWLENDFPQTATRWKFT